MHTLNKNTLRFLIFLTASIVLTDNDVHLQGVQGVANYPHQAMVI